jgi:hypothetical protein
MSSNYNQEVQRDRETARKRHEALMQHIAAAGGLDNLEVKDRYEAIALCEYLNHQQYNSGIEAIGNYLRSFADAMSASAVKPVGPVYDTFGEWTSVQACVGNAIAKVVMGEDVKTSVEVAAREMQTILDQRQK